MANGAAIEAGKLTYWFKRAMDCRLVSLRSRIDCNPSRAK